MQKVGEKVIILTNITLYTQILEAIVIFTLNLTKKFNCYMPSSKDFSSCYF